MAKTFFKFAGFIFLKWILFYAYQIIESGEKWDWSRVKTNEDIYFTAWMLLALPILELIILIVPFQLALKQKGNLTILILLLAFFLEFAIGWFATNQNLETWMIVKIVISTVLFILLYRKQLQLSTHP